VDLADYGAEMLRAEGYGEDWGLRLCASETDYDRILSELGAVPYDEVMAAEQDQGMSGMVAMA